MAILRWSKLLRKRIASRVVLLRPPNRSMKRLDRFRRVRFRIPLLLTGGFTFAISARCGFMISRGDGWHFTRKGTVMNLSKQSNLVLVVVLCAVLGVMVSISRANSSPAAEATTVQDVSSLDRRLSLIE